MSRPTPPDQPAAPAGPAGPRKEGTEPARKREGAGGGEDYPAAGPHARPDLTNPMATPGAGLLPDPDDPSDAQDSTSG